MGTKVYRESYLSELYSMRDLNDDCSTSSWPFLYGGKNLLNGQYYNGFVQRSLADGCKKDALKQTMLEHEAVFKNQVCELHRLYRIQRDMMDEAKRNETNKKRISMEPASSSNLHDPQAPLDEARKWFPSPNSNDGPYGGVSCTPTSCLRTNTTQPGELMGPNGSHSKPGQLMGPNGTHSKPGQHLGLNGPHSMDSEGSRPVKVRKKLFDLRLPADEYIDIQEWDLKGSNGLADLNEPVRIEDDLGPSCVDFLGRSENSEGQWIDRLTRSNAGCFGDTVINPRNGFSIYSSVDGKTNMRERLDRSCEAGSSRGNYDGSRPDMLFLPSHTVRDVLNRAHNPPSTYPSGFYNRQVLESSNRNRGYSYFATSYAQPVPHWAHPTYASVQNSTGNVAAPDCSSYRGSGIFSMGPATKPAIDINLIPQDMNGENQPDESHPGPASIPWLKPMPVAKPEVRTKGEAFNLMKTGLIDINVACDPDESTCVNEVITPEKEASKKGDFVIDNANHEIDLNLCPSESEDSAAPEQKTASVKITLDIDLEAPVFLDGKEECPDTKNELIRDEVLQNAAEAIFAISSSVNARPKGFLSEAINWFVDAILSHPNENSREIDEFEAMTLELAETRDEDYISKPFAVEIVKTEEENEPDGSTARPRRGKPRKGRQRKDFQRDILPGLTTLSRHEVSEDLQIFGGLMRATGHSWNSGQLARRNIGGRGRRRAVAVAVESHRMGCGPTAGCSMACTSLLMKQIQNNSNNNINERLTGWGKTTRRPRRQRCPAGNISMAVLT